MKIVAIVQARMKSTRLPGKVMKLVCNVPLIGLLFFRLSKAKEIDQIILATSVDQSNDPLVKYIQELGYFYFRGSENDVLDRYLQAAKTVGADVVVRITGDCPLIDPSLVDKVVSLFREKNVDYFSNISPPTYPDGLDVEVFTVSALERASNQASNRAHREHVTPFIRESGLFVTDGLAHSENLSFLRWTIDEPVDFEVVKKIFEHFSPDINFLWTDILRLHKSHPKLFEDNSRVMRNQGALIGAGQKLWGRAKQVIPGGNMLLSKRAEMFLPDRWPSYFSEAKGCMVRDLDGNDYIDMSIMGVGTNILGYGRAEVDEAVIRAVKAGNMSTLNCPDEVYLAEKLIEIHPWADMVKFARTGGEANAIAIRIARAASARDKVAVCGYHGWHDWYLSANLGDEENLAGHLLPGLTPKGVPQHLHGTVYTFNYNNFSELLSVLDRHDIGVIKMEVLRNKEPEDNFLHKVREIATDRGIVLIFDECTSGFRETLGGLHKKYGVEPDIAIFGKALGNGYAITSIIGRKEVMEAAQSTFISSTFWTERIGSAAALKTLEIMESEKSWNTVTETGLHIRSRWRELADKYNLKIDLWGIPALSGFTILSSNSQAYKTLITQEMLAKGYLASNSVYVCTEHTQQVVRNYFDAIEPVFLLIKECEEGRNIVDLLGGPVCHDGFRRLN